MSAELSLVDDGRVVSVPCEIDGDALRLPPEAVRTALGWELRDEGLCKGDVCIPAAGLAGLAGLGSEGGIRLDELAAALRRPLALDVDERTAALGTAVDERAAVLADLMAPHFELPDLEGRLHSLSQHRGKKVLLIAYASW